MKKFTAEEFEKVKHDYVFIYPKKRSAVLDEIAKLEIGEVFVFKDFDWDLKSPFRQALHNRFIGNRRFEVRGTLVDGGQGKWVRRIPLKRIDIK